MIMQPKGGENTVTNEVSGRKSASSTEAQTKQPPESTEERDAYSIEEFCRRHNVSHGTFYNMRKRGQGPREARAMTRVLITKEAAADWRKKNETPQSVTK
jgi:hypothetical protein